jgi:hypothetical protein
MRIVLPNAKAYDSVGKHSLFSAEHCCICGRPMGLKSEWLLLTRAEDGSREYAIDHPNEATPDERRHSLWVAPIGLECLRQHPELEMAVL